MKSSGVIYAIGAEDASSVKIGRTSRAVSRRLAALQTAHPLLLRVIAHVPVEEDILRIEKAIHHFLEAERQQGEWFSVQMDQPQLEALIMRAVQYLAEEDAGKAEDHTGKVHDHAARTALQQTGQRIMNRRRVLGLTQEDLAAQCGFRYQVLSRVESGHQDLYAQRLARIALALGVSADYLLGLPEKPSLA